MLLHWMMYGILLKFQVTEVTEKNGSGRRKEVMILPCANSSSWNHCVSRGWAMVDQTKGGMPGFYSQRMFRSRTMSKSLIPDVPGSTSNLRRVIRGQDLWTTWNTACPSFFYPLVNSWETHMHKTGAFGWIQFDKKFSLLVCFHFLFLNKRY